MLGKVILGAAALLLISGTANAADVSPLPRDWSGMYVGVHVGLAQGVDSDLRTGAGGSAANQNGGYCVGKDATDQSTCEAETSGVWTPATDPTGTCTNPGGHIVGVKSTQADCGNGKNGWTWVQTAPGNPASCSLDGYDTEQTCTAATESGQWVTSTVAEVVNSFNSDSASGDNLRFLAGLNAGYNFQVGQVVFGAEADISGIFNNTEKLSSSSISPAFSDVNNEAFIATSARGEFGLEDVGTLRARLGYDIDGHWLPFITGGLAFGRVDTRGTATYEGNNGTGTFTETHDFGDVNWEMGWTLGAGINYKLADNAFIGLTYLYTDLGSHSVHDSFTVGNVDENGQQLTGQVDGKVDAKFSSVRLSFDVMF